MPHLREECNYKCRRRKSKHEKSEKMVRKYQHDDESIGLQDVGIVGPITLPPDFTNHVISFGANGTLHIHQHVHIHTWLFRILPYSILKVFMALSL